MERHVQALGLLQSCPGIGASASLSRPTKIAMRNGSGIRSLVPQAARERLYAWHPGRARRWRRYPGIQHVQDKRHAVLTFDDGPDEDATGAVLDALDAVGARATFFILGTQLERNPELGHAIVRRGHEVGLHGYEHLRHDRVDPVSSADDLSRGLAVIEAILGIRCRWFRPPYGKMSDAALGACRALDLASVYWSAWGLDWEPVPAPRIAREVCAGLEGGAIVLLHDSARHGRRASALPTADAIPAIAYHASARQIALVSLGEADAAPAAGLSAAVEGVPTE